MKTLSVYKNTDITNGEMLSALQKLGFYEVEADADEYKMLCDNPKWYFRLPRRPLNEFIVKAYTATFSNSLLEIGLIKDFDDLVKMVLKERTKKRRDEKKQTALSA